MANLERVAFINHMIKVKGFVTRKEVADHFEVHIDTVMRDIEYMRNFLSAPLKYTKGKGGYVYETPFEMLFNSFDDAVFYYIFVKRFSDSFNITDVKEQTKMSTNNIKSLGTQPFQWVYSAAHSFS